MSLHNRTDVPQTFLWWANVAARSHERYQSFFPDDVGYVADHARRAITAFPRADRPYYGVDYPSLVDEARPDADRLDIYSNIPVPTSYMVTDTADDFFGGYDHGADAGFVHWADRAMSPGKKQWTWGNGAIGHAWDAQLTDDDGPYVELMAGVYTDNQPDFSWLAPGETKRFSQYWYPIHRIGPARQATTRCRGGRHARRHRRAGRRARDQRTPGSGGDGDFGRCGDRAVDDAPVAGDAVRARVPRARRRFADDRRVRRGASCSSAGAQSGGEPVTPWVATAPEAPEDIASNDELYLTAVHLVAVPPPEPLTAPLPRGGAPPRPGRHAGGDRARRPPSAAGRVRRRRPAADRGDSSAHPSQPNPRDGEAAYLHGLVFERRGDLAAADASFAKAAWTAAWAAPASLARARLALRAGDPEHAAAHAEAAGQIPEARRIAFQALRAQGRRDEASALLRALRAADPLDPATRALDGAHPTLDPRTSLDVASEFARAGAWLDALEATRERVDPGSTAFGDPEPLRHYLRAGWLDALGRPSDADEERRLARSAVGAYAFPAGLDHYDALRAAVAADPEDDRAHGLLGMWLLDAGRPKDAFAHLRTATDLGSDDPVAWRNLALATVECGGDLDDADAAFQRALALRRDARLVFERDLLAQVRGLSSPERLALVEEQGALLEDRDDLALVRVSLLLDVGRTDDAWRILTHRTFRPFEGGEGRVIAEFDRASCAIARAMMDADPGGAARLLAEGADVPANLGEGRHPAFPMAERLVLLGDARRAAGDEEGARSAWESARAHSPLAVADRPAEESDYWTGVAHLRLGELDAAAAVWDRLDLRADELDRTKDPVDYFATSLPELLLFDVDTQLARSAQAERLRELAASGRSFAPVGSAA